MLTDIYFDDNIFFDEYLKKSEGANQSLIDSWRDYGRLAYDKNRNVRKILASVPIEFSQKWQACFSHFSTREIEVNSDNVFQADFNEAIKIFSEIGVSSYILAEGNHDLILNESRYTRCETSMFEAFMPSEIAISNFHTEGKVSSEKNLVPGDDIENIWNSRFKGLAKYSNKILIIDRYVIQNTFEDLRRGKTTSIEKFIELVSRDSKSDSVNIVIYSSEAAYAGGLCNLVEIQKYLRESLSKRPYYKNSIDIEINICPDPLFKIKAHDRFIAFENHVVEIGSGMLVFSDNGINDTSFNIKNIIRTNFLEVIRSFSRDRIDVVKLKESI